MAVVQSPARPDRVARGALFDRSVALILEHQATSGAYPAGPTFSQYNYSWLRDGSFIAYAMDRVGEHASAARFLDWVDGVVRGQAAKIETVVRKCRAGEPVDEHEYCHTRFTLDGQESADEWWNHQLDGYGTWLWLLVRHVEMTGDRGLLERYAVSVRLTVDYLRALWREPNYDCWEENRDRIHPATLACLFGGLHEIGTLLDDPDVTALAADIRAFVEAKATGPGHLVKYLGTDAVDASLLWAGMPFGLFDLDAPVMRRTVERIEADLWHGGVHRYLDDSYYGGGEWVLLTAWLGWLHAAQGSRAKAVACRDWVEAQVDAAGLLPEQVADHALFPDMVRPWVERWGPSAKPLLWSHAMYLVLCTQLAETPAERLTADAFASVEHWPEPREGTYPSAWPERFPERPEPGQEVRVSIRVRPAGAAPAVAVAWSRDDGTTGTVAATWEYTEEDNADRWLGRLPGARAGAQVTYRILVQDAEHGPWSYAVADWRSATRLERLGDDVCVWTEPAGSELALAAAAEAGGTRFRLLDRPPAGVSKDSAGQASPFDPLVPCNVAWDVDRDGTVRRVRFGFDAPPGEAFYGLGERFNALDQRGNCLDVHVYEQYKHQGRRTYMPVPFLLSSRGYGVVLHSSRYAAFDLAAHDPSVWSFTAEAPNLSWTLLRGEQPAEIVRAHADLVGHAVVPPEWAFGPWMSSNDWNNQARVEREVATTRELDIPASVLVIEAWSDESTFYVWNDAEYAPRDGAWEPSLADFRFPTAGRWPDPKGLVERLHAQGIKLVLWQIPVMKKLDEPHAQHDADERYMLERGYAVREADGRPYRHRGWWFPDGLVLDATSEAATDWWLAKRRYLLDDLGIDGFKTDGGEHVWGRDLRFADGTTGAETCNRYPVLYEGAYYRYANTHRPGAVIFSRSGFAGAQAFPCHWAGDEDSTWAAFRHSILAGLNAGLSGIPFWGWDIGGFSGELPTPELYLRAAAMATFCPIMQYHSEWRAPQLPNRDRTPWNVGEHGGEPRVVDIYRSFAWLRMRLLPYIVAEARRASESGLPLMRAMPLAFPDDPAAARHPYQYLFGERLLVAPVVRPGVSVWEVYLPAGTWQDFWSHEVVHGPRVHPCPSPLERIPVFVRDGAPGQSAEISLALAER